MMNAACVKVDVTQRNCFREKSSLGDLHKVVGFISSSDGGVCFASLFR